MGILKNFFKKFDLFSKQFMFQVGDSKNKKTLLGGSLSFGILAAAFVYLYYMLYLYFTNQVQPTINIRRSVETERFDFPFQEELIFFQFSVKGQGLFEYQQQVNRTYFDITTYEEYYAPGDGVRHATKVELVNCEDSIFQGYYCVGPKNFKGLMMDPITTEGRTFSIRVEPCDDQKFNNCATREEMEDFNVYENYLQLFVKVKQFNSKSQQFEEQVYFEYYYIDINTYTYSRLSLVKADTDITTGAVLQEKERFQNLYEYKKSDNYMTYQGTQKRMGMNALTYVVLEPNQEMATVTIQYPMITSVLAQFMSVFNCLIIAGIIFRFLAHSYIYDDLSIVLLKNYYKKTAMKLIEKEDVSKTLQNSEMIKQSLEDMQKTIEQANFKKQGGKIFRGSCLRRYKLMMTSIIGKVVTRPQEKESQEQVIYTQLISKTLQSLNIYQLYTDIIQLKMAIKLMFTKEQYAAFFYCGSELLCKDQFQSEMISQNLQPKTNDRNLNSIKNTNSNSMLQKVQLQQIAKSIKNCEQNLLAEQSLPKMNEGKNFNERKQLPSVSKTNSNERNNDMKKLTKRKSSFSNNLENSNQQGDNSADSSTVNLTNNLNYSSSIKSIYNCRSKIRQFAMNQKQQLMLNSGDIDPEPINDAHLNEQERDACQLGNNQEQKSNGTLHPLNIIQKDQSIDENKKDESENNIQTKEEGNKKILKSGQLNKKTTKQKPQLSFLYSDEIVGDLKNQRTRIEKEIFSFNNQNNSSESFNPQNDDFVHKLKEMDAIEEQNAIRLKYVKVFLSKMNKSNNSASYLDKMIFENLIFQQKDFVFDKNVEDDELNIKSIQFKQSFFSPSLSQKELSKNVLEMSPI